MVHLKLSRPESAGNVLAAGPMPARTLLQLAAGGATLVALVVLAATGNVQLVLLGLMSLLAVGGAFLVFGFATGILHLGDAARNDVTRSVAEGLADGVQLTQRDGTIVYRNAALITLLKRRSGAVAGLEEVFAQESDAARAYFRLNRAAERGETREEEFYFRNGFPGVAGSRWLRVSVQPVADRMTAAQPADAASDGRTLWHVIDITRERTREIETVSSLEATLGFYDGLPQGLFAVRPDGRLAHLNATLAQWLNLRTEAGRAFTLADILPADGVSLVKTVSRTAPGKAVLFDLDLLREDGSTFPAQLICRGQGPRGMTSVLVLDRSLEPQRSGQRAFSEEARLARQAETAPFGIATVAADGQIITSNPAFLRMFSADDGKPLAATLADLALGDAERAAVLEKALARASAGRTGTAPIEIVFGAKNEHARRLYVYPLGAGGKGPHGAILYALDVSEQKALELKFAQSHKMEAVGQLAGGVAHDFNNVLTAIIGFSDLLLQTHRPTDRAYGDIMNIKNSANRAAGLVSQLLAFSRRQTLQPEVIELGEALTDLAPLINRSLGETIELKIQPGRDLWHVKADKSQLTQVVINLAVNARDAMPKGGSLTIRTRNITERDSLKLSGLGMAAGEFVLIEVEDTGCGIPADVIGKIFEPFFTTKDVGKGTGLGLSTVYGIVKQTGGYIYADSTVGKGTTFRVYLPRHVVTKEEIAARREGPKKEPTRDLTGTGRVLLVEDEDAVRNFASRALARQGYEVLEAMSGLDALEVMEREGGRIDLVVSDVIMPEMDGPSMLKEMLKTRPYLKIIFVSGYPDDAFKKNLDEGEVYSFLPKPFTLPQLAAKVKEQLGR